MPTRPAQPKLSWIEKAKATHKFHLEKLRDVDDWRLEDTASALKRSVGNVCEDLLIASWLKTHARELEKFDYQKQALEFIRQTKDKLRKLEID